MEYIPSKYKIFCDLIKPIIMDEIKSKPENENIYKYDSLTLSTKSNRLRWIYNTARYEIIRLAMDTGYSEGDYHSDNILIDENTRRSIIIDYGKAKKIDNYDELLLLNKEIFESEYSICNNNIDNIELYEKLKKILNQIFYTSFEDNTKGDEFMWLKNIDEIDYKIIMFLHENRKTQENLFIS